MTVKEVLIFCSEFTFYDQDKIERVIEFNPVLDFTKNVLSENDSKHEDNRIRVLNIIDYMSLKVIDGDAKIKEHEIMNLRIAVLRMLCHDNFFYKKQIMRKQVLKQ